MPEQPAAGPLYIVEHLEEGLEDWCRLEYRHICSFVPPENLLFLRFADSLDAKQLVPEGKRPPRTSPSPLEELLPRGSTAPQAGPGDGPPLPTWDRVCLLDMDAEEALEPEDDAKFDAYVFGGILGNVIENPDGSYSSDDRTAELRRLGFRHRRHLGPLQMTTDTAVLVCQRVIEQACPLAEIPFLDSPEIGETKEGDGEDCVCMEGFRYVARRGADGDWEPTLPEGMKELLTQSADHDILDSL